jgi:Carboxypeptidase regulatory-like domain
MIQGRRMLTAQGFLVAVMLFAALHGSALFGVAQTASATLSGTVVDQDNAVVPGVQITITNTATGLKREAQTNDGGHFTIPLLPPSSYVVRVEHAGFAPIQIPDLVLNVNDNRSLQIQLKVAQVSGETVTVSADANTIREDPAVATVINRRFVENLPLNGRSFQALINLSPGVVATKASFANQGTFSVNGQRGDANYFTVDGVSANFGVTAGAGLGQSGGGSLPAFSVSGGTNNLVSVDALQEFKIQTSTYAPEFGRTPGAQVQILTRSGTNNFHGSFFEYFRDDSLDAKDWFVNANRLPKPVLRQNQFGGVFGGPLYLPRFGEGGPALYDAKDRTFFFFSYEGLRLRLPQVASVDVPSIAARQNPNISSAMRQLLNALPVPNGPVNPATNMAEFVGTYSEPSNFDSYSLRIDHNFSQKFSIFGRYNFAPSENIKRSTLSPNRVDKIFIDTETFTAGSTWIVSPTVSNEFRLNWSKSRGANLLEIDNFGGAVPPPDSLLFPAPFTRDDSLFVFNVLSGRFAGFAVGQNVNNIQRQLNLVDNVSLVTSAHQLKFGVDYRRLTPSSNPIKYQQAVLGDLNTLLTNVAGIVIINALQPINLVVNNFSAYAQDTWKASRRLTLTYGLRWELNPPPSGDGTQLYTLRGLDNLATATLAPAGTPLYNTDYKSFAPRFGLSYQLSQRQGREALLRGGFGVFYDLGSQTAGAAVTNFPYIRSRLLFNVPYPLDPAIAQPPAFTLNPPVTAFFSVIEPDLELPRTYQWNLAMEQSLGSSQTISVAYIGAMGRHLLQKTRISNPAAQFQNISLTKGEAESNYHALQIQFQRRLARRFQALASYTFAKSEDTVSFDDTDPNILRGPSDFDVRHSFSAAVTYNIPSPKLVPAVEALLRGWAIDGIFTARSATPFNLIARSTILLGGVTQNIRPDLVSGTPIYLDDQLAPGGRRLNPAAFVIPPVGRQGTLGRNLIRGFSVHQTDLGLRRKFSFTEKFNLQLRAELFNIFNHPNFADPVPNLTSGLFGRSTQMLGRSLGSGGNLGGQNPLYQIGGPRSIQLSLKVQF